MDEDAGNIRNINITVQAKAEVLNKPFYIVKIKCKYKLP